MIKFINEYKVNVISLIKRLSFNNLIIIKILKLN